MRISVLAGLAIIALIASPVAAQERRTASDQDVLTQGTVPAPDNGAIQLSFGQSVQVYFRSAFKSIRIGDPLTVSATPQNDHIVTFTGLSPGTSSVTLEGADGKGNAFATIKVVRPIHEVRVYTLAPSGKNADGGKTSAVTIVNNAGANEARASDDADFRSLLCNDAGCQPVPRAR